MKKLIVVATIILMSLTLVASAALAKAPLVAPDFTLQDTHQDEITLSSYKKDNKPVLLFFWTTWCPFCQKELPVLKDMYSGLVKDGVEVLSINIGEDPNKVIDFVKPYRLPFRVLLDKDTTASNAYKLVGVPSYVLVGKNGDIVFQDNFFPSDYKNLVEK